MDTSYPAKTLMGRDMSGLRIDKNLNNISKPNGTNRPLVYVAPRIAVDRDTTGVDDHSASSMAAQDSHEKTDVLGDKRTNLITGSPGVKTQKDEPIKPSEKKLSYPVKPASGSTAAGLLQAVNIVPEARSSLANDSQNPYLSDANGAEMVDSGTTGTDKTNELHSTSIPPASMGTLLSYDRKFLDEDDNLSLASSAATSVRTTRSKLTVPVAPTFKCADRIERRKEYYLKLEEKHKALEAEKIDYAARTKEEEQAAVKQLRKSMMYKANPVPNFYREGPPPKVELKKLPVTRPKSPNLSRRKSCSDASKSAKPSPDEKGACARVKRHSIGFSREVRNSPTSTFKTKDVSGGKNLGARASRESPNSAKSKNGTPIWPKQNSDGRNRFSNSPRQVKETSKTRGISAVEEVTVIADRIAEITVIEETAAVQKQLEPEAAIMEEERNGSHMVTSEITGDL